MVIDGIDFSGCDEWEKSATMTMILLEDVIDEYRLVSKDSSDVRRRSFIRVVFSSIEAYLYQCRQVLLREAKELSPAVVGLLKETRYKFSTKGAKELEDYMPFLDSYVFTFQTMIQLHQPDYRIDNNSADWNNFVALRKKRDRLTHPKTLEDIYITQSDIDLARKVFNWHHRNMEKATYAISMYRYPNDAMVQWAMNPSNSTVKNDFLEEIIS